MDNAEVDEEVEHFWKAFPAYNQSSISALKPGKYSFYLESRQAFLQWSASRFLTLPQAFGISGLMPRRRKAARNFLSSYPLSHASSLGFFLGLPALPSATRSSSSRGSTCFRSSAFAAICLAFSGIPLPSTMQCIVTPFPLKPCAMPFPPPFPGGKRGVDGSIVPVN